MPDDGPREGGDDPGVERACDVTGPGEDDVPAARVATATPVTRTARRWAFGGLAAVWWMITTFVAPGVPAVAAVAVLGLLVAGSVEPDARVPTRGVALSGRNLVLAALAATAFVAVLVGREERRRSTSRTARSAPTRSCSRARRWPTSAAATRWVPRPGERRYGPDGAGTHMRVRLGGAFRHENPAASS